MEIKINDKIKFLNDIGGGTVIKIIDKELVLVRTNDGFEYPVSKKEVIKSEETDFFITTEDIVEDKQKSTKKNTKKKNTVIMEDGEEIETKIDLEELYYQKPTDEINIFLAFVPQNQKDIINSNLDIYLINDSNFNFLFNILRKNSDNLFHSNTGKLSANTKDIIAKIKREDIVEYENLYFQFIFFKNNAHQYKKSVEKEIKLNLTKLFKEGSFVTNDFFNMNAFIVTIYEENMMEEVVESINKQQISKVIFNKEIKSQNINTPRQYSKNITNLQIEVDLHIHQLLDDHSGLKPAEILEIQMQHFHKQINDAIKNPKVDRIVFIHGLGNGTLKTELTRELDRNYKKYKYQDASFKEYGYGATLVFIKH